MPRYIDVEKIDWRLIEPYNPRTVDELWLNKVKKFIDQQPTADVRESVHGEWIETENDTNCECSICHECFDMCDNDTYRFVYCPHCGARMDIGLVVAE